MRLSRRKLFSLLAGVLAAPKELLAKTLVMKTRQPGITAPNGSGGYQFGFTDWKEMPESCEYNDRIFWIGSREPQYLYWSKPPADPEKFPDMNESA